MNFYKKFSHIYIEKEILENTYVQNILQKFPNSHKILLDNYKEKFNPNFQEFTIQKKSMSLILAKKKDEFLYDGSRFSPNFGFKNFYYTTPVLNCIFDCEYCYLQGMFSSSNIVVFVNFDDFKNEVLKKLQTSKPMYLCISYDTDLLALENLIPFTKEWIHFANLNPGLYLEIRTKSANFRSIQNISSNKQVILAWTISPEIIVNKFEPKTPSLESRLKNIQKAIEKGWKVRICIDPVLFVENWQEHYQKLLDKIRQEINVELVQDFSLGFFRMNTEQFKNIKKGQKNSSLYYYPYQTTNGFKTYPKEYLLKAKEFFQIEFQKWNQLEKLHLMEL